jgi:hypothetical protein
VVIAARQGEHAAVVKVTDGQGLLQMAVGMPVGEVWAGWNVPLALPRSTRTVLLPTSAVARSSRPSRLMSAVTIACGFVPAG